VFTLRTSEQQGYSAQRKFLPSADLSDYVRSIEYRESLEADDTLHPLAFSVFPFVSFYLGTPCAAFEYDRGECRLLPRISVVGPCDHRVADFAHGSDFRTLRVVFEPTGFFRLFRISPAEIRNLAHDGIDVLGRRAGELHGRLCETRCPEQMVEVVEQVLRTWCTNAQPKSGIQLAAQRLLYCRGRTDLSAIASSLGLSASSWRRHFTTEIGVTPKRYFRMLRFEHAVGLKLKFPEWSWTQVCLESGYYDQAHFIADCQAIARCTPSRLMREIAEMPGPLADAFYGQAVKSHERVRGAPHSDGLYGSRPREVAAAREGGSSPVQPQGRFLPVRAA
jgi:AraC-like DNA-binding protein